jgi:hypothetical protein
MLTLVNVVFGWKKVAAGFYMALSLWLAYVYLRWNPHMILWMNQLKAGVATMVVWCSACLVLLVFVPLHTSAWAKGMTILLLVGLIPSFGIGMALSRYFVNKTTKAALGILT